MYALDAVTGHVRGVHATGGDVLARPKVPVVDSDEDSHCRPPFEARMTRSVATGLCRKEIWPDARPP